MNIVETTELYSFKGKIACELYLDNAVIFFCLFVSVEQLGPTAHVLLVPLPLAQHGLQKYQHLLTGLRGTLRPHMKPKIATKRYNTFTDKQYTTSLKVKPHWKKSHRHGW